MPTARYFMRRVGEPSAGRLGIDRASDAGISYYRGFHDIFEPAAAVLSA
jgi:hypothetical protein